MTKISFLKKLDAILGRLLCSMLPRAGVVKGGAINKVLFIRPGGIGDAALLVPALHALRTRYPEVKIDVLAERRNAGVFALASEVGEVFLYDKPTDLLSCLGRSYDVVIDTEQWHRLSAVIARLVRARRRIGFSTNERQRMFSDNVDYCHETYEAESFLTLLKPLGIDADLDDPFIYLTEAETGQAQKGLAPLASADYVVLFPGASVLERQWGIDKFADLAKRFVLDGLGVVVVGGDEDRGAAGKIVDQLGDCAISLAGQYNLSGSASVIAGAKLLVSGDSGVLHIAVGVGTPSVSLFGPGIERKWAPRSGQHIVINKKLDCSPCTRFGYTPACPIDVECMKQISVDEVYSAVRELLGRIENSV